MSISAIHLIDQIIAYLFCRRKFFSEFQFYIRFSAIIFKDIFQFFITDSKLFRLSGIVNITTDVIKNIVYFIYAGREHRLKQDSTRLRVYNLPVAVLITQPCHPLRNTISVS